MAFDTILGYFMTEEMPFRKALKKAICKLDVGSFMFKYRTDSLERMQYAFILLQSAHLALRLGINRVSVIEFGVAGGQGLLVLEYYCREIEKLTSVAFDIYGFDTGIGLPPPADHRDLPYHWKEGSFSMDEDVLRSRIRSSRLILGDVKQTIESFVLQPDLAPIGAVIHDMDFYSSTAAGLELFSRSSSILLPRVYCYFDDTLGSELELYSDYTGERLAINEFNESHASRKLSVPYFLRARAGLREWRHQIWVLHVFDHNQYNTYIGPPSAQLPI